MFRRVLRRLELDLSDDVIRSLSNCKQRVVEKVLMMLRVQIDKFIEKSNRLRLKTLQLQNVLGIKDPVDPELDPCMSFILYSYTLKLILISEKLYLIYVRNYYSPSL